MIAKVVEICERVVKAFALIALHHRCRCGEHIAMVDLRSRATIARNALPVRQAAALQKPVWSQAAVAEVGFHVGYGAFACRNQFVPARLLGPDIRHSSFHAVACFLVLFGVRRGRDRQAAGNASVSVIIPTFNGGSGLDRSIASLHRQTLRPVEIIVVDDGSTDETRAVAERARTLGLVQMVICHGTRCGRSAAINAGARFSGGDLLLTVDADTVFEPTAVARLAAAFADPRVGGASCNIAINNERELLWTGLQSLEYLMSISAGRSLLDVVDAIACLSGACSMYRRDTFVRRVAWTSAPERTSSTACGCAVSVTSFVSCRTPGRKQPVRQAA